MRPIDLRALLSQPEVLLPRLELAFALERPKRFPPAAMRGRAVTRRAPGDAPAAPVPPAPEEPPR